MQTDCLLKSCFAALLLAAACCAQAPSDPAHSATAKTAEQQFKNIQALKGTPADQVIPAMQFISASLGVECEFCHVAGKFDSDDKRSKQTARRMIAMTLAINKNDFGGHLNVTCYSCHRGSENPVGTPPVASDDTRAEAAAKEAGASAQPPDADQVLSKYVAALGGADAIHKITTRVAQGHISAFGRETPIDLYMKAPNRRMSVMHAPNGDSITAFDGAGGWLGNSGHPPRQMSPLEAEAAALDAEFYFATRIPQIFQRVRPVRPEKIGDREAWQLLGLRPGQPPVRLYFDQSTGLLVRLVRYTETPVGRNPTQIDYADYREVDGVKIPFRWTLARPGGRFTIQVDQVHQNVPVDDSKFVRPATPTASGQSPTVGH